MDNTIMTSLHRDENCSVHIAKAGMMCSYLQYIKSDGSFLYVKALQMVVHQKMERGSHLVIMQCLLKSM